MPRTSGGAGGGGGGGGGGGLLAVVSYAPSGGDNKTVASGTLTDLDTTNLTIPFTTAESGLGSTQVLVRLTGVYQTGGSGANYWGLHDHTSHAVVGHLYYLVNDAPAGDGWWTPSVPILVTGLTANTAYQFDWCADSGSGAMVLIKGITAIAGSPQGGPAVMEVLAA